MFEKNLPEKGGSFYLQSKIYFAKEHLMEPFPKELNKSKFNPEEADATREAAEKEKEAKQEQEKEAKGGKGGAKT